MSTPSDFIKTQFRYDGAMKEGKEQKMSKSFHALAVWLCRESGMIRPEDCEAPECIGEVLATPEFRHLFEEACRQPESHKARAATIFRPAAKKLLGLETPDPIDGYIDAIEGMVGMLEHNFAKPETRQLIEEAYAWQDREAKGHFKLNTGEDVTLGSFCLGQVQVFFPDGSSRWLLSSEVVGRINDSSSPALSALPDCGPSAEDHTRDKAETARAIIERQKAREHAAAKAEAAITMAKGQVPGAISGAPGGWRTVPASSDPAPKPAFTPEQIARLASLPDFPPPPPLGWSPAIGEQVITKDGVIGEVREFDTDHHLANAKYRVRPSGYIPDRWCSLEELRPVLWLFTDNTQNHTPVPSEPPVAPVVPLSPRLQAYLALERASQSIDSLGEAYDSDDNAFVEQIREIMVPLWYALSDDDRAWLDARKDKEGEDKEAPK